MNSCNAHALCRLMYTNSGNKRKVRVCGVYRMLLGKRQGQNIWIVDGDAVFRKLYPAFVMGGNDQRYRFNPPNDIWIDNRIGVEELHYTVTHELLERRLMRQRGWSYGRAHQAGLALEKEMRLKDRNSAERKNRLAFQNISGVYRLPLRRIQGLSVWIVDGPAVRQRLNGDFCFGAHGYKYDFIPKNEIWLDSSMTAEQVRYALVHELKECALMREGMSYAEAYDQALAVQLQERFRQERLSMRQEARLAAVTYGTRERGVKSR